MLSSSRKKRSEKKGPLFEINPKSIYTSHDEALDENEPEKAGISAKIQENDFNE